MDEVSRILKDKKVVLFDFDGTLVDSMGMWGEVDKAILRLHGLPIPDNFTEEFMFPLIPLTEEETAQFFLDYCCKGTVKTILDQIEQLTVKCRANPVKHKAVVSHDLVLIIIVKYMETYARHFRKFHRIYSCNDRCIPSHRQRLCEVCK